jgi:inorganic triphosphatase YgiF
MPQAQEIELKLAVPAERAGRLARLPLLKGVTPDEPQTLQSVYFDTAKQTLRKHGLSLRLRRRDGRFAQTVKKRRGRSVGLFERDEWECPVENGQPDLAAARDSALAPLIGKKLRRRLRPVFETRVERTTYPLRHGGSDIALTVNRGKVKAAGRSSPLCEIELELKSGEADELFALARALDRALPVRLASKSKAAHGYDLLAASDAAPVKAEPIALTRQVDWAAAFQIVARACLYQVAANEAALRKGDAEAVHQMRIGLRRLRAAMSLFKDIVAGPQTEAVKAELKWLTGELGPARELEVFVKRVVRDAERAKAPSRQSTKRSGLGFVAKDIRKRRAQACRRAQSAVASPRFRRLLLEAAAWIEAGDWKRDADDLKRALRARTVPGAAADELARRRKKIREQGKKLATLDARHRHKLRIKAKKLRYATEFFAGVFAGKKQSRRRSKFVARLKAMQDALGDLTDIAVHDRLAAREMASAGRRGGLKTAFAAGHLSGRERARFAGVMRDAERACAAFAKAEPFWR